MIGGINMAGYQGYLLMIGKRKFPMKYIAASTYISSPNQRTELKAYTNAQNKLIRQTSSRYRSKVEFETPPLFLDELEEIRQMINQALINAVERKVSVKYWNDEDLVYKTMICYAPDIDYKIKGTLNGTLLYEPIRFAFIEY